MRKMLIALGGAVLGLVIAWLFQPEGRRVRRKTAVSARRAGRSVTRAVKRAAERSRGWVRTGQEWRHRLQPLARSTRRLLHKTRTAARRATLGQAT